MSLCMCGNGANAPILTPISSVSMRKENNFPHMHRVLIEQIGVKHLKRHCLHWSDGFIYLNTPTMRDTDQSGVNLIGRQMDAMPCCRSGTKRRRETAVHRHPSQSFKERTAERFHVKGKQGWRQRVGGNMPCDWKHQTQDKPQVTNPTEP